jgi:hypothetical protein
MIDLEDGLIIAFLEGSGWRKVPDNHIVISPDDLKAILFRAEENLREKFKMLDE